MAIHLNHTIVAAHDKERAARFLTTVLGLPAHSVLGGDNDQCRFPQGDNSIQVMTRSDSCSA